MYQSRLLFLLLASFSCAAVAAGAEEGAGAGPATQSLDGDWRIARDPEDQGRSEKWYEAARFPDAAARPAKVPGAIGEVWMGTGVWSDPPRDIYWYGKSFVPRLPAGANLRYYLRFGAVKHASDVWLNGAYLGAHEGGEDPFEYDVTGDLQPGRTNTLGVRIVSGLLGGINQHVTLVAQPEVRIIDAFARPDAKAGEIKLDVTIENDSAAPAKAGIHAALSEVKPALFLGRRSATVTAPPGQTVASVVLPVAHPHLWDLNDPFLYAIKVTTDWKPGGAGPALRDAYSFRTGFRDFRIVDGYFQLNGRRIFPKSTHGNYYDPLTPQGTPRDMTYLGRDFPLLKKAGFNMMRMIVSAALPEQLDEADEMGFLIYSEHETSWLCNDPKVFGNTLDQVVRRDRNHPSLVLWGLLNETSNKRVYERARDWLPSLREIDDTRLVLLSSGRWDQDARIGSASNPGSTTWNVYMGGEDPVAPKIGYDRARDSLDTMGDVHVYPDYPLRWSFISEFAKRDQDVRPFFFSESGIGSSYNFIQEKGEMEAAHAPATAVAWRWITPAMDAVAKTWATYGLDETYPSMNDMFIDSGLEAARQRELIFSIVRGNPKVNGYSLTSLEDFWGAGEGFMDNFRVFKPGHLAVLQAGWAPLRWCLLVNPTNAYADEPIRFKVALANEDILPGGDYPAALRLTGSGGVVWTKEVVAHIRRNGPLAYPLFDEDVRVPHLQPGAYNLEASLDGRPNAASGEYSFTVTSRASLPALSGRITVAGVDSNVRDLLTRQGAALHDYAPGEEIDRETILVGAAFKADAAGWRSLYARAARGAHIVFLSGQIFHVEKGGNKWLALPAKGDLNRDNDWLYHKDVIGKIKHPLLAGLQTTLMTPEFYGMLLADTHYFQGTTPPADAAAVAIYSSLTDRYRYFDGLMLGTYPFHAGHFTLNAFNIAGSIGSPATDRLLLNLLTQARADAGPLVPLPAGYDAEMEKLGIRE